MDDLGSQNTVDSATPPAGMRESPVSPSLSPGDVLGNYEILSLIAEGGMGRVYRARHRILGRRVALKTLRPELCESPQAVRRFFTEARAVNQIAHEHIVEITDFVEDGPNKFYVMELLEGETLSQRIQRGALSVDDALDIAIQVGGALAAAHRTGVVHRDLKPDNVLLLDRNGRTFVKLLDFGVAKLFVDDRPEGRALDRTNEGAIIGTPEYMSPEQLSGTAVTDRSDVYSLGLVLYEMLTGSKAHTGASFGALVVKHLTTSPVPVSQSLTVSAPQAKRFDALLDRLLAKDGLDRPSAAEAIDELEALRAGAAPSAGTPRWQRGVAAGGAVVALVVVAAALRLWVFPATPSPPQAPVVDAKPVDTKPVDVQPVGVPPIEQKPVEPADAKPADAKPADVDDGKPADKPADKKAAPPKKKKQKLAPGDVMDVFGP